MSNADTQRGAVLAIHVLNAVAALLRLAAVARASYAAAVASSLALGAGTSLVVASYAAVPLLWLPQQERAAGVAWLVQGNYAGWALGAAATPAVVVDGKSFGRFVFFQALACVVMVPVAQLLLPGSAPTTEPLLEGPPVARATLGRTIADLARRLRSVHKSTPSGAIRHRRAVRASETGDLKRYLTTLSHDFGAFARALGAVSSPVTRRIWFLMTVS